MRADTMEWCKNAIDNWFIIYTWSSKFDWRKSWASWVAELWNWGWHAFIIDWYNNRWFTCPNSFWEDRWDGWYFTVPYEYFDKMFSKNVIIDKDDTWIISRLSFDREFQKAIEAGITNWERPNEPATRKETAVMIYRSLAIKD